MPSFGNRLQVAFEASGRLCVGIDPHPYLLESWGLPDSATGVRDFGLLLVDEAAGLTGMVKPQVAFFERHGAAGFLALEEVLRVCREAGLLVIADVKRGDLGPSAEAYAEAWLSPSSPLEVDAITMSPYLGLGSLELSVSVAKSNDKGVFVLAATSNPEAPGLQTARTAGSSTVAAGIVAGVKRWNPEPGLGSVGVVVGATVALADFGIDPGDLGRTPILAPGFGHQGAKVADLKRIFGVSSANVIVAASRSIAEGGPGQVGAAIARHRAELGEG